MNVLVDTSIWSVFLRRSREAANESESRMREELAELIREDRAQLIGPIRQELLSGIREDAQFTRLRQDLRRFPDETLTTADYESAAQISNSCRTAGIAGSPVDFLICAVAIGRDWEIFTADRDFQRYAGAVPMRLYRARR